MLKMEEKVESDGIRRTKSEARKGSVAYHEIESVHDKGSRGRWRPINHNLLHF